MTHNVRHSDSLHVPVLAEEVLSQLNPQAGEIFIDATMDGGGHFFSILERIGETGILIGIDWDPDIVLKMKQRIQEKKHPGIRLARDSYTNIREIAEREGVSGRVNGILFDLGFSSFHVDQSGRGFSFLRDEPLDMRYDPVGNSVAAESILKTASEKELEQIFREFGEERWSKKIAHAIVETRKQKPFRTTKDLVAVIEENIPRREKIHPATRVFQALRIAVNNELENITKGIQNSIDVLAPNGALAVISFHSLEDRIVKNIFKEQADRGILSLVIKKPLTATYAEQQQNPRARSAKLRVARKN